MPRIGLETLARELQPELVPAAATLTVQAWAGEKPFTQVAGERVIVSPLQEVVFRAGVPDREVHVEPTLGAFCYRVILKRSGVVLIDWYVEVANVDEVAFGDLQQVDPATFLPVPNVLAGWETTRMEVLGARDETVAAAAAIADRTLTATPDPDDPGVLILTFPSFMLDPDGSSILLPLEAS